jgi:hypothetical protein
MVNPHLLLNNPAQQKYLYTFVPIETSVSIHYTIKKSREIRQGSGAKSGGTSLAIYVQYD